MQMDAKVQEVLNKINAGKFDALADQLGGTDFGIYVPSYQDGDVIKLMEPGFAQVETNLGVKVLPKVENDTDTKTVGWFGAADKDSSCSHGGTSKCRHCTSHQDKCRHCTHTKGLTVAEDGPGLDAPPLDYDDVVKGIPDKQGLLNTLAVDEIGLALLHGHNDEHEFTKLPEDYVSVIANGVTSFRPLDEVKADETFVPNTWRFVNGKLEVAGGFSLKES